MYDTFYIDYKDFTPAGYFRLEPADIFDCIREAQKRSRTKFFWVIAPDVDLNFDFLTPPPWEQHQVHLYGLDAAFASKYTDIDTADVNQHPPIMTTTPEDHLVLANNRSFDYLCNLKITDPGVWIRHDSTLAPYNLDSWVPDFWERNMIHVFDDHLFWIPWTAQKQLRTLKTIRDFKYIKYHTGYLSLNSVNPNLIMVPDCSLLERAQSIVQGPLNQYNWALTEWTDYDNFEFPVFPLDQQDMIHVYGDTIMVPGSAAGTILGCQKFEDFKNVVYHEELPVKDEYVHKSWATGTDLYRARVAAKAARDAKARFSWALDERHDYTNFEFMLPKLFEKDYIFKYGSTMYVPASALEQLEQIQDLKDFEHVVYKPGPPLLDRYISYVTCDQGSLLQRARYGVEHAGPDAEFVWVLSRGYNYQEFDFPIPDEFEQDQIHVHGNTLLVPVRAQEQLNKITIFEDFKYVKYHKTRIPMDGVDMFILTDGELTPEALALYERFPDMRQIEAKSHLTALREASRLCRTKFFWLVSDLCDYSEFSFDEQPILWEQDQIHVYGENKYGDTYLVPASAAEQLERISSLYDFKYIQYHQANIVSPQPDMFLMDYGLQTEQGKQLEKRFPRIQRLRYTQSHHAMLKRAAKKARTNLFWVLSELVDYSDFNFDQEPPPWEQDQIHVWGSDDFGDTFYVPKRAERQLNDINNLIDFEELHWHEYKGRTQKYETVQFDGALADAVRKHDFKYPYAMFTRGPQADYEPRLWDSSFRSIIKLTKSGSVSLVPKDCKTEIRHTMYDTPNILRRIQPDIEEKPLDVVFISNGEKDSQKNYERLQSMCPRAKLSEGVDGRVRAYQAAAEQSETAWFFAVFAKCWMLDFDFQFQPDYFQEPKHYIFQARNPVNGLVYGHQAVVLYNRDIVLNQHDSGLDFTLSGHHTSVPLTANEARFNTSAWATWRTAFREVLKLMYDSEVHHDITARYRADVWLTQGQGDYAEYSLLGAKHAVQYFHEVQGDLEKLKESFDWEPLKRLALSRSFLAESIFN